MCSYNITVIVPPTLMQAKTGPKQKPVPGGGGGGGGPAWGGGGGGGGGVNQGKFGYRCGTEASRQTTLFTVI